jgi:hypothetical protein
MGGTQNSHGEWRYKMYRKVVDTGAAIYACSDIFVFSFMRYPDLALSGEGEFLCEYRIVEMDENHVLMRLLLLFLKTRFPRIAIYWSRATMLQTNGNTNWTHIAISYFRCLFKTYSSLGLPKDVVHTMFLVAIEEWSYSAQRWVLHTYFPLATRFMVFRGEYTPAHGMEHLVTDPKIIESRDQLAKQNCTVSIVSHKKINVCLVNFHPNQ